MQRFGKIAKIFSVRRTICAYFLRGSWVPSNFFWISCLTTPFGRSTEITSHDSPQGKVPAVPQLEKQFHCRGANQVEGSTTTCWANFGHFANVKFAGLIHKTPREPRRRQTGKQVLVRSPHPKQWSTALPMECKFERWGYHTCGLEVPWHPPPD